MRDGRRLLDREAAPGKSGGDARADGRCAGDGVISGLGGIGAAAGPLIGGLITTGISWRAAFVFQAAVVAAIILLSRRMVDPVAPDPTRPFDVVGALHRRTHGRARPWRRLGTKRHKCDREDRGCRRLRKQKTGHFAAGSLRLRGRDSNPNFLVQRKLRAPSRRAQIPHSHASLILSGAHVYRRR
jgi:MFS family permease